MRTTKPLNEALFGRTRGRILGLLYGTPDQPYFVREIARRVEGSASSVHSELKTLDQLGLLERSTVGNQVLYLANRNHLVFAHLHALVARTAGVFHHLHAALAPLAPLIRYALVYGAVARADEQTELTVSFQSEPSLFPREHVRPSARVARMAATGKVDLLVIGTVSMDEVRARLIPVQDALHRRISVTIYSFEQYKEGRASWSGLIGKVLRGKRVFLLGDDEDFRG